MFNEPRSDRKCYGYIKKKTQHGETGKLTNLREKKDSYHKWLVIKTI